MAGLAESGADQKLLIAMLEKLVDTEDTAEGRAGVGPRPARMYERDLSDPKAAALEVVAGA